jgi:hypothetical protein
MPDNQKLNDWLNNAEESVHHLPDRSEDGSEEMNTHNNADLFRVAKGLHSLAPERCSLPGRPTHFSKAEVLRNLRSVRGELEFSPPPEFVPTDQDFTILAALEEAARALTVAQIVQWAGDLYRRKDRSELPACLIIVGTTAVRARVKFLREAGLIAHPKGRQARSVGITEAGRSLLARSKSKR